MFEGEGSWNKNEDNKSEFTGDRDDIGVEEKHSTEDSSKQRKLFLIKF